jgi:hypothetical protein
MDTFTLDNHFVIRFSHVFLLTRLQQLGFFLVHAPDSLKHGIQFDEPYNFDSTPKADSNRLLASDIR